MLESRISTDRRVIFREPFTSESIAKNGGVITGGVSLSNGVATMDGTGYITYAGNKDLSNKSQFTIRMKARRADVNKVVCLSFFNAGAYRVDFVLYLDGKIYGINCNGVDGSAGNSSVLNDSELHDMVYVFDGSGATDADRLKIYFDGSPVTLAFPLAIPATTTLSGTFDIGKWVAGNSEGSFELVEIYDSALSPEECSLISQNKLYAGFIQENCVLFADYLRGTSLNWKNPAGIHTDTNVVYKHGLGANFDSDVLGGYINYGAMDNFDYTESFSIESCFIHKCAYWGIVTRTNPSIGQFGDYCLNVHGATGDILQFTLNEAAFDIQTASVLTPGLCYHVVATYDKNIGKGIIYLSAVNIKEGNYNSSIVKTGGDSMCVGNYYFFGISSSAKAIKYTRLYDRALTPEEVTQNHQYAVDNYGAI